MLLVLGVGVVGLALEQWRRAVVAVVVVVVVVGIRNASSPWRRPVPSKGIPPVPVRRRNAPAEGRTAATAATPYTTAV